MIALSFVFALLNGNMEALSQSITAAAADSVTLSVSLLGITGLWCGVIRVLEQGGMTQRLSRMMMPFFRLLYPTAARTGRGIDEIAANFAANLLGLGNAALPLGLAVMKSLTPNEKDAPSVKAALLSERVTFAVMNTVPPQLFPTTLIALRTAANSAYPYEIIFPIYIVSAGTVLFAAVLCRVSARISENWRCKNGVNETI